MRARVYAKQYKEAKSEDTGGTSPVKPGECVNREGVLVFASPTCRMRNALSTVWMGTWQRAQWSPRYQEQTDQHHARRP